MEDDGQNTKKKRTTLSLPHDLLDELDEYADESHIDSRSKTVEILTRDALEDAKASGDGRATSAAGAGGGGTGGLGISSIFDQVFRIGTLFGPLLVVAASFMMYYLGRGVGVFAAVARRVFQGFVVAGVLLFIIGVLALFVSLRAGDKPDDARAATEEAQNESATEGAQRWADAIGDSEWVTPDRQRRGDAAGSDASPAPVEESNSAMSGAADGDGVIDDVLDGWRPGRSPGEKREQQRAAGRGALEYVRAVAAPTAAEFRGHVEPQYPVDGQSAETWWRKTARPALERARDEGLVTFNDGVKEWRWVGTEE